MSQNLLFGVTGWFPSVSFYDEILSDHFDISTTLNSDGIGCEKNVRVVRVPFCDDLSQRFVAVSGYDDPYPVLVYDVNSQQRIANCLGHQNSIYGLTCLSSTDISSNPKIVSGGWGDKQVLVFDALNGTKLCALPDPPSCTLRILHVPEWNSHSDVFVGGVGGDDLFHYDLTRPDRKMGSFVGHSIRVWGLSANVTENILFSASWDKTVRLWSQNDYSCQRTINLSDWAMSCCYMKDRNLLIVGLDNVIELHDIRRLSDDDVPVQKVKVVSSGRRVEDIIQIDNDRFVCGGGRCLVVCELPSGRVIHDQTNVPGNVKGVCVFEEFSSGPGVLPNDELMREIGELRRVVELREREVEESQHVAEELRGSLQEKHNRVSELQQSLEGKVREVDESRGIAEGLRGSLQELRQSLDGKVREVEELGRVLSEKDESLQRKDAQLQADGLSTRTREFCRRLDTQRVSTLDLLGRYRLRGCIDFREHILSSSDFDLARESSDGRFAFRDIWFEHGRDELSLIPFEEEEGAGEVLLSVAETITLDLFNDYSLAEIVFDESHVSRDDMLDLQEDWDGFFRSEPVYDTAKLMEVCEDSTRRKVSFVVSRIFDFFGGKVTDELRGRYEAYCGNRVASSECLLGSLKGFGLGRHRSLCFKVACDRLGIPCRLIRGWRTCSVDGLTVYEQRFADAWCVVNLCDRLHFVDLVVTGSLLVEFHPVLSVPGMRIVSEELPSIDLIPFGNEYSSGLRKELLGHGGFGQVFAVEFEDDFVAVKETNLTQRIAQEGPVANARVRREVNLMCSFNHPNIVHTYGSFQFVRQSILRGSRRRRRRTAHAAGDGGTIIGIVMPLYDQNATVLREILREADSLIALRETLLSVANGLRYLHSLSILHLDMKPDNVLVNIDEEEFTLSEIRICDFGGSRPHCTLMSLSALPVSLGFCSPEVKQAAEGDKTIVLDESADVYSFGALMRFFTCYFGTFRELYELCDRCLSVEMDHRPNLIEVMSILRSHLLFVDRKCGRSDTHE